MQYIPKESYQPACAGFDKNGELVWHQKFKDAWQQKMFPMPYRGDFGEQWMWLVLKEKGFEWTEVA